MAELAELEQIGVQPINGDNPAGESARDTTEFESLDRAGSVC